MASQKVVAVLLVCLVLVAAVQVIEATEQHKQDQYKQCLEDCDKKCEKDNDRTYCEMKCDSDCGKEEFKANLATLIHSYERACHVRSYGRDGCREQINYNKF